MRKSSDNVRTNRARAHKLLDLAVRGKIKTLNFKLPDGSPPGVQQEILAWALHEIGVADCRGRKMCRDWTWVKQPVTEELVTKLQDTLNRIWPAEDYYSFLLDGKKISRAALDGKHGRWRPGSASGKQKPHAAAAQAPAPVTEAGLADRVVALERLVAALDGRMADQLAVSNRIAGAIEALPSVVTQTNRMMLGHDNRSEKILAQLAGYLSELLDKLTAPAKTEAA
jgi:hypothetical protein